MNIMRLCSIHAFRAFILIFISTLFSIYQARAVEGNLVYLADTDTGDPVAFFDFGKGTINLQTLPGNLTFVAFESGSSVKSVVFYINGVKVKTENFAPYAIAGDQAGNLNPFNIPEESFQLSVKYFSERNGQGDVLLEDYIDFCVVNLTDTPIVQFNSDNMVFELDAGTQRDFVLDIQLQDTEDEYLISIERPENIPGYVIKDDFMFFGQNPFKINASNLLPGEYNIPVNFELQLASNPCFSINAFTMIRVRIFPSNNMFVSGFQVINSENGQHGCDLLAGPFTTDGHVFTYDWFCLPDSLSIETKTYGDVESVVIEYSYTAPGETEQPLQLHRIENIVPYSLFGDSNGGFVGIRKRPGRTKIRATPYSENGGKGIAGNPLEVEFTILGNLELNIEPIVINIPAGEKLDVPFELAVGGTETNFEVILDYFQELIALELSLETPLIAGTNHLHVDASNSAPRTFHSIMDVLVEPIDKSFVNFIRKRKRVDITINILPSNQTFVQGFDIGDSDTDQFQYSTFGGELGEFSWETLPDNIYIQAHTYNQPGSVVFEYAYTAPGEAEQPLQKFRTENLAPYSLFGDGSGGTDFFGIPKQAGKYQVRATTYSQFLGKGEAGSPLMLSFTILADSNQPIIASKNTSKPTNEDLGQQTDFLIYPNPVRNISTISYAPEQDGNVKVEIYDIQGSLVKKIYSGYAEARQELQMTLNRSQLHEGVYICKITTAEKTTVKRVMVK